MLSATSLCKRYGSFAAVNDVSFQLVVGDTVGIIGHNGSGKSTLCKIIAGQLKADDGFLEFDGRDLLSFMPHEMLRLGIALIPQNSKPIDKLTVLENITMGTYGKSTWLDRLRPPRIDVADKLCASLGIRDLILQSHLPLSPLNKRKTCIARALISEPRLLVIDEPTAGLNQTDRLEVIRILESAKRLVRMMVIVEHARDVVGTLCNRFFSMEMGSIQELSGATFGLLQNPGEKAFGVVKC